MNLSIQSAHLTDRPSEAIYHLGRKLCSPAKQIFQTLFSHEYLTPNQHFYVNAPNKEKFIEVFQFTQGDVTAAEALPYSPSKLKKAALLIAGIICTLPFLAGVFLQKLAKLNSNTHLKSEKIEKKEKLENKLEQLTRLKQTVTQINKILTQFPLGERSIQLWDYSRNYSNNNQNLKIAYHQMMYDLFLQGKELAPSNSTYDSRIFSEELTVMAKADLQNQDIYLLMGNAGYYFQFLTHPGYTRSLNGCFTDDVDGLGDVSACRHLFCDLTPRVCQTIDEDKQKIQNELVRLELELSLNK